MPRVSVIMPMHNALPYLAEAVESIIAQTLADWELFIIDDASTDESVAVAQQFCTRDPRIKLLINDTGTRGSGPSRNVGIEHSSGDYIAMMDADDISTPGRLAEQVAFMDTNPHIMMSGCWVKAFGRRSRTYFPFTRDWLIKALIVFYPIMFHGPSIIYRRSIPERYSAMPRGQDMLFVLQLTMRYPVANLAKVLYHYRVYDDSFVFHPNWMAQERKKLEILLPERLGFQPSQQQIDAHLSWEKCTRDVSWGKKLRWIMYVVRHGRFRWYERPIIFCWYLCFGLMKTAYLAWYGR